MSNNNNDENKNGLKVEARSFKVSEPLDDEQRRLMYKAITSCMKTFTELDTLYDERFPENTPDRNVKRAFAMASNLAEFVVDFLEKNGCTINMDSQAMQGVLTPLLLPAPIIACDAICEIQSYIKGKESENGLRISNRTSE